MGRLRAVTTEAEALRAGQATALEAPRVYDPIPLEAKPPKRSKTNDAPVYPKALLEQGVTGELLLKALITKDGRLKRAKVLQLKTSASTDADEKRARKLFRAAVVEAVKGWRFAPATLHGEPISVWFKLKFPFELDAKPSSFEGFPVSFELDERRPPEQVKHRPGDRPPGGDARSPTARAPRPKPGNHPPSYPVELVERGVTGRVVVKVKVFRDGTVRGAKVLAAKNSEASEPRRRRANKLLIEATINSVKSWRFEPATLDGKPITAWQKVTLPFSLRP